ncbi:MAG: hypothetical protein PHF56_16515 [Desulfuromonadaceae bacterium]|nr:hypothetical protein [Desulfuromonadaceae bacterium]
MKIMANKEIKWAPGREFVTEDRHDINNGRAWRLNGDAEKKEL